MMTLLYDDFTLNNLNLEKKSSLICFSDSGLEKDGSFIKFSGYSGEPSALSPPTSRRGRFRKRGQPMSMVSLTDHVVGENQGKRGIIAKVLLRLDYDTHFEYDSLQIGQLSIKVIQTAFNTLF